MEYRELYTELEDYENQGVDFVLDGYKVSAMQIVTAHMVKEEAVYMRNYDVDGNGYLKTLSFTEVQSQDVC